VDKGAAPGHGSTSASTAVVRFNFSTLDGVILAWESYQCWAHWADHLGIEPGPGLAAYQRVGALVLDDPVMTLFDTAALLSHVGVPYSIWDPARLKLEIPAMNSGRHWPPKRIEDEAFWGPAAGELSALCMPDGGYIDDPVLAAQNLADAAGRCGARSVFRQRVAEVRRTNGRTSGVTLGSGDIIEAPVVVNVAGPWSGALNDLAGVGRDFTIAVRPMRQEVHEVVAPAGYAIELRPGPCISDLDLGIYLRPSPAGSLLVGGTEPACDTRDWIVDPDDVDPDPDPEVFTAQVTRARRRLPDLVVPTVAIGIVGVYDVATDWTPIYDRTELDGYYVAMGTSGNQFKNAPVVGQIMAELIDLVESGHDHDRNPLLFQCPRTGQSIDLGSFSRKREVNSLSPRTVMG
jgi:glycine/D-amino acid oxidase-like deaminating enzyme